MPGPLPTRAVTVLVDVDDNPISPATLDAALGAAPDARVVVVNARTTPGRAWLAQDLEVVTPEAGLSLTQMQLAGAAAAEAEFVAFLDARAVPASGWLAAAVATMVDDSAIAAVTGAVEGIGEPTLSLSGNIGAEHPAITRATHDVLYPLPELTVFRFDALERVGGIFEALSWPCAIVDVGWRLRLAGFRVVLDPSVRGTGVCRCEPDAYSGLVVLYSCLELETLTSMLPAAFLVATSARGSEGAVDRFLEDSERLALRRREIETTRTVADAELLPLLIAPLEPPRGHHDSAPQFADAAARHGLGDVLESRHRILVVTPDILTGRMAGPAIRAWQIADALADRHVVTLASTASVCEATSTRFSVGAFSDFALRRVAAGADVVVLQGFAMEGRPYLKAEDKFVVVDLYDPLHLEQLELFRDDDDEKRRVTAREATRVLNEQLVRGDFFMCASPKQRDFWLGQLAALGRLNHRTYDDDRRFEKLLTIVPFGVSDAAPIASGPGAKGQVPGIAFDDKVVLWGGGIYNWFDPLTLIRAIDGLKDSNPSLRLLFMGLRHPNPEVSEMRVSMEARRIAAELRLVNRFVFFNEGWVPYDERQNFLLEAAVGVSTHFDHVETEFSFRTRILDYIWAGLPIVATRGDWFADLIEREGIGLTVPPGDVEALERALDRIINDDHFVAGCKMELARVRERFGWSTVLEPVTTFVRRPRRAPDLSDVDTRANLWASDADRLEDFLRRQPTLAQRVRRALADL